MDVVTKDGCHYCLANRRLWVFKQFAMRSPQDWAKELADAVVRAYNNISDISRIRYMFRARRDAGKEWGTGFVTSIEPLEVIVDHYAKDAKGYAWYEVRHIPKALAFEWQIWATLPLHNAPIFRLLLKVAVNGTHQCDFLKFGPLLWM